MQECTSINIAELHCLLQDLQEKLAAKDVFENQQSTQQESRCMENRVEALEVALKDCTDEHARTTAELHAQLQTPKLAEECAKVLERELEEHAEALAEFHELDDVRHGEAKQFRPQLAGLSELLSKDLNEAMKAADLRLEAQFRQDEIQLQTSMQRLRKCGSSRKAWRPR